MGAMPVEFGIGCGWSVAVFCGRLDVMADGVLDALDGIDCPEPIIDEAEELLRRSAENTGLTYTNRKLRTSVLVIGEASSPAEFFNSLTHESRHLEAHIAQTLGLDPFGEEICYIAGEIAAKMFGIVRRHL